MFFLSKNKKYFIKVIFLNLLIFSSIYYLGGSFYKSKDEINYIIEMIVKLSIVLTLIWYRISFFKKTQNSFFE